MGRDPRQVDCNGAAPVERLLSLLVLTVILGAAAAHASQVERIENPRRRDGSWVTDEAGVLDNAQRQTINTTINALERDTSAEIAVVTIRRVQGQTPKQLATGLFNRWGVGKAGKDNGVVVLVSVEDRRIEVETGYGVEGVLPDGKVGKLLQQHAVPRFRANAHGEGIVAVVDALAVELRKEPPMATRVARRLGIATGWVWGGFLSFLGALGLWGSLAWAWRPRSCPKCNKAMRHLPEDEEDNHLRREQIFEEKIRSVQHHVWRCEPCNETVVTSDRRWFSGYTACPRCRHHTRQTSKRTISHATTTSTGAGETVEVCKMPRCGYTARSTYVIPMIVESSSSDSSSSWSSSSFGGGSSGGGGSGASW